MTKIHSSGERHINLAPLAPGSTVVTGYLGSDEVGVIIIDEKDYK
jgi:hypothetical protein